MPGLIIAAAVASIVVTALLTFVLWRMNAPMRERRQDGGGGDGGFADGGSGRDGNDGTDGGGGSDGDGGGK